MLPRCLDFCILKGEFAMETYHPAPVDTSDVILSPELLALTEQLAASVHDTWAIGRMQEGWQYAPGKVNPDQKTTPLLVPYDQLPESEKQYDRNTALQTLKLIHKLGYKIIKV